MQDRRRQIWIRSGVATGPAAGRGPIDRFAVAATSTLTCSLLVAIAAPAQASDVTAVAATVGAAALGTMEPASLADSTDSIDSAAPGAPEFVPGSIVEPPFDFEQAESGGALAAVPGLGSDRPAALGPEAARQPRPAPASPSPFESALPSELSMAGRSSARDPLDRTDVSFPIVMLEQRKLGPLVVEQPVRVYENDVTVKLRAPGRRRSFATVEVTF